MRNIDKFEEVFGHRPDIDSCPFGGISCGNCKYYKYSIVYKQNNGLPETNPNECCQTFWFDEYKAPEISHKGYEIMKTLDNLWVSMSYAIESDPRSFKDREHEYGWLFDKIISWRKDIYKLLEREK